ncbi:MAG: outer membrane lipoprotein carrier protein LolA [Deltaproteobacteria bacterium]|jgi:outer membrane lipoprotein carrier protein|nr:outer membrane lipoprotein carrier protein LolA [Deltaproteobacteria bacterium]
MQFKRILFLLFMGLFFDGQTALASNLSSKTTSTFDASRLSLDEVIEKVEKHYSVPGFSANFSQTSSIKAMEITDSASGRAFFKRSGKMRWEYETPDRQMIITDGKMLWVFRPEDNQVMIGKAPSFFKDGKGFSFLSDMEMIRQKFSMVIEKEAEENFFVLKLLPREKTYDIVEIYLWISSKTFEVVRILTYNSYGDETRIVFNNIQLKQKIDDSLFGFEILEGMEVLHLDEHQDQ